MNKVIIINHFDSFVFNIHRYILELGYNSQVIDCENINLDIQPSHLIFSPGPLAPPHTGMSSSLMQKHIGKTPILGICLGSLILYHLLSGTISTATKPSHGQSIMLNYKEDNIFNNLPNPIQVGLYHSLMMALPQPKNIEVLATCQNNQIMAIKHKHSLSYGLQFHPESILTPQGKNIIANFLKMEKNNV